MNKGVTYFVMFAIGAVAGSVATWQYTKNKYDQLVNDEIEAVKESYRKKEDELRLDIREETYKDVYKDILHRNDYTQHSQKIAKEEEPVVKVNKDIEIIPPEEYGEIDDYQCLSFTYYADGVLADEDDTMIINDHIENTIGSEALSTFGRYEDDSVFVRNDKRKCYYEILLDQRNYDDAVRY